MVAFCVFLYHYHAIDICGRGVNTATLRTSEKEIIRGASSSGHVGEYHVVNSVGGVGEGICGKVTAIVCIEMSRRSATVY